MKWNGKIIGALIGLMFAGPIGLFVGLVLGYFYDKGLFDQWGFGNHSNIKSNKAQTKRVFFETTFAIMGHIAKSDGRITQHEISAAQKMMSQLNLSTEQKRLAIDAFNHGKQAQFDLTAALNQLKRACLRHPSLLRTFFEMQIQIAYAEGEPSVTKRHLLESICKQMGLTGFSFSQFEQQYRAQYQYQQYTPGRSQRQPLSDAYRILGVKRGATNDEVKKAYRRLMSHNHPDKLIAKGVPENMIQLATKKTQQIKKAYDSIKASRGM